MGKQILYCAIVIGVFLLGGLVGSFFRVPATDRGEREGAVTVVREEKGSGVKVAPLKKGSPATLPVQGDPGPIAIDQTIGTSIIVEQKAENAELKKAEMSIGGIPFTLEIADTRLKQIRGLTRREAIQENYGMVYVLDAPSRYAYWMKDMFFATDVVWLDAFYRVIDLEAGITPETYPKIYEPDQPALFVLELPAGSIQKAGITLGGTVDLSTIVE